MKKLLKIFLVLFLTGLAFVHFYVPRLITVIETAQPKFQFSDVIDNGEMIDFKSDDGLNLKAHIAFTSLDTVKGTVILIHGIRAYKEHFIQLSQTLNNYGFNAVAVDLRAHGESEGTHCTFGAKEKHDIENLVNELLKDVRIGENIGVWGQSLGGVVAIQAMGHDSRIKFGIIESTFSSFPQITHDYFERMFGFNIEWFTDYLIWRAGSIAEFDPQEAMPKELCKKISQRVLMVHGTEDKRIKMEYGVENFKSLASNVKRFMKIDGAGHLNVWKKVVRFILKPFLIF